MVLRGGQLVEETSEGFVLLRAASGSFLEPLAWTDWLAARFPRLYLIDLDGIVRNRPQLDYIQEITRNAEVWVDAGCRTAEQAIDVLVAGARVVVLSSAYLDSPREVGRCWKLSTDIAVDLHIRAGVLEGRGDWKGLAPAAASDYVRSVGTVPIILSYRDQEVDWGFTSTLARQSDVWLDGDFRRGDGPRLEKVGVRGGIFSASELLPEYESAPGPT
jgi:histidine biosynthesis protein